MGKKKQKQDDSESEEDFSGSEVEESGSDQEYSDESGSGGSGLDASASGSSDEEEQQHHTSKTNTITQLAYAVTGDIKNPKGKTKEIQRLRRWLTFAKRKTLLTLHDLGEVSCGFISLLLFATFVSLRTLTLPYNFHPNPQSPPHPPPQKKSKSQP